MFVQSFRSAALFAGLTLGAATCPSALLAQQGASDDRGRPVAQVSIAPASAPADTVHATSAAGPRIAPAGFTRHTAASVAGPTRPIDSRRGDDANVATMGVGAAAVGLGLIMGGDGGTVVAVTGGVVGLVGLYRYLR